MADRTINNIKLGVFVLIGLIVLIVSLYMIGKDTNLFSKNYALRVRFDNIKGLMVGNNVRYAGIQVGTIKKITILSDTLVEINMLIDEKMKKYIHKDDIVSISTDGLVGNKLLNIAPGKDRKELATEGDILLTKTAISTDEMLEVLNKTNNNIAEISQEMKSTVQRLNNSSAFWQLLNEKSIPDNLKKAMLNINEATVKADNLIEDLHVIVADVKDGKGNLGTILRDSAIVLNLNQVVGNLNQAVDKIKVVGDNATTLATELNTLTQNVRTDINSGKGTANAILKDSILVSKLNNSLSNIESGTAGFSQNMEALKHNFLFKGYFKKLEKQKKKEEEVLKKAKNN